MWRNSGLCLKFYVNRRKYVCADETVWGDKFPTMVKSWRSSAGIFIDVFQVPTDIRLIIYTTNTAEAVHRQFQKLTKTRREFPNDNSWLQLLSIGLNNAINKWTMPTRNRNLTLSQMTLVDVAIEL